VPPIIEFLVKHPLVDKYDLSSLNVIYSGAAALSKEKENQITNRIGKNKSLPILKGYGMTELGVLATFHNKTSFEFASDSVGSLVPGVSGKVSN